MIIKTTPTHDESDKDFNKNNYSTNVKIECFKSY